MFTERSVQCTQTAVRSHPIMARGSPRPCLKPAPAPHAGPSKGPKDMRTASANKPHNCGRVWDVGTSCWRLNQVLGSTGYAAGVP